MRNKIVLVAVLFVMVLSLSACIGDSEIDKKINGGNQKLEDGEYEKAAELFKDALELDKNDNGAKYGLAAAYINMGKFEEADEILSRVQEGDFDEIRCDFVVDTFFNYQQAKSSLDSELYGDSEEEFYEELRDLYHYFQSYEPDVKEEDDTEEGQTEADSGGEAEEGTEDEVVVFKDPVFEQAIRKGLELPEGPIMLSSISEVKHVAIYQVPGEIKTIEDLKLFENIELLELNCNENDLTIHGDLSTIAELSKLTFLRLCGTDLTGSLSDLSSLSNLKTIQFDRNSANHDLSELSNLTSLKNISMWYGNVTGDLSSLSHLSKLRSLDLMGTGVTGDLSSLSQFRELHSLDLNKTGVTGNLSALSQCTELDWLHLDETGISGDLSGISGLTKMESLSLNNTAVSGDLSVLSGLKNLGSLCASGSNITGKITLTDGSVYDAKDHLTHRN